MGKCSLFLIKMLSCFQLASFYSTLSFEEKLKVMSHHLYNYVGKITILLHNFEHFRAKGIPIRNLTSTI